VIRLGREVGFVALGGSPDCLPVISLGKRYACRRARAPGGPDLTIWGSKLFGDHVHRPVFPDVSVFFTRTQGTGRPCKVSD